MEVDMIPKPFKEIKKVDLIENGKVNHCFKITFLNNSSSVFDNKGNEILRSKIINNKKNEKK